MRQIRAGEKLLKHADKKKAKATMGTTCKALIS